MMEFEQRFYGPILFRDKDSTSFSRSQMSLSATDCTLPAESPFSPFSREAEKDCIQQGGPELFCFLSVHLGYVKFVRRGHSFANRLVCYLIKANARNGQAWNFF